MLFRFLELRIKNEYCSLIQKHVISGEKLPCWGYESDCKQEDRLYQHECPLPSQGWTKSKQEQKQAFFETADFGYVERRRRELRYFCKPSNQSNQNSTQSDLKCTDHLRYCTAHNIFINFQSLATLREPVRYREDILQPGELGGWNCDLNSDALAQQAQHKSPLMSWFAEMNNFQAIPFDGDPLELDRCDIVLDRPTLVIKLDATTNMYHHFCDFINLYLSFHLNRTTFNVENHIVLWDTIPDLSNFAPMWTMFTSNPVLSLKQFIGKRVCFRDVMFPLLPRMIYGMYYNMPLIPGCHGSGVFRAFNRHILKHFNLPNSECLSLEGRTFRITFISRNTRFRRVLNQHELIDALNEKLSQDKGTRYLVEMVDFSHRMPFTEQIKTSSASDILVGMHGAGLTHALMQPDYGALFELYNCLDPDCYQDLARLRGLHYVTWPLNEPGIEMVESDSSQQKDKDRLGLANAKFVNYRVQVDSFVRIMLETIEIVKQRKNRFKLNARTKWWMNWNDLKGSSEPKDEL